MGIFNYIRERKIRRAAYQGDTGMRPLSAIKKAMVLIDAEDPDFEECQRKVSRFFAAHGIDVKIFYVDFRKMGRDELITICIQTTLTRKRTNLLGLPDKDYMLEVKSCGSQISGTGSSGTATDETDAVLFVSLVGSAQPAVRMIASAVPAGFKVGVADYPGSPYSLVVTRHSDSGIGGTVSNSGNSKVVTGANGTLATVDAVFKNLEQII